MRVMEALAGLPLPPRRCPPSHSHSIPPAPPAGSHLHDSSHQGHLPLLAARLCATRKGGSDCFRGREKRGGRREVGGLERNGREEDGGSFRVSALFPHLCGDASYFTWGSADEEDLDTSDPVITTLV